MNIHDKTISTPKVTTGSLPASKKVYSSPDENLALRVPFREIQLTDSENPTFQVYDTSGPYSDPDYTVNVESGLPRMRESWVNDRGNIEEYEGREIKPEDNGNAGKHWLVRFLSSLSLCGVCLINL